MKSRRARRVGRRQGRTIAGNRVRAAVELLEERRVLDSTVVISEVMYHPAGDIKELEWIELHNQLAVDVELSRWQVHDAIEYTFPQGTVIPGGGYVVIAASPTALAASTGYSSALGPFAGDLSNGGERIQLVNHDDRLMDELTYGDDGRWPVGPDGSGASLAKRRPNTDTAEPESWVSSLEISGTPGAANFPDTLAPGFRDRTLIASHAPVKAFIPTDGLGASWTAEQGFNDNGWTTGTLGAGYDADASGSGALPIGYWSFDGQVNDGSGNGHDGTTGTNTYVAGVPTPIGTGQAGGFNGASNFVGAAIDVSETEYAVSMWFKTTAANTGLFSVVSADQGGDHDRHLYLTGGNIGSRVWNNQVIASTGKNYADGQWHHVVHEIGASIAGQRIYVDGQLVASGNKANSDFNWQQRINIGYSVDATASKFFTGNIDDVAVWSRTLSTQEIQSLGTGVSPLLLHGYTALLGTDVRTAMQGINATAYLRVPFNVDTNNPFDRLILDVRYDDGFVAYLNGVKVAERNAPAAPLFNSPALGGRLDRAAVAPERIDITSLAGLLHSGPNLLAIQALNESAADADLLFDVQMTARLAPVTLSTQTQPFAFNEVAAATASPFFVELFNRHSAAVSTAGYIVAVDGLHPAQYAIPAQSVPSGGRLVLNNAELGFQVADGDRLFLYGPGKAVLIDAVTVRERLRGRSVEGAGDWLFPDVATPGAANHFALHSDIVINEIMYDHRPTFAQPGVFQTTTIMPVTTSWQYNQAGASLGTAWRDIGYNDTAAGWASATGVLATSQTVLAAGTPRSNVLTFGSGKITYYFRTHFQFNGDLEAADLQLRPLFDDGAIFYLNGFKILTRNLPDGVEVPSTQLASPAVGDPNYSGPFTIPTDHLVIGDNLLAVEVHNANQFSFDVALGVEVLSRQATVSPSDFVESPEEWIELYNRGAAPVDLTGWRLDETVDYNIPAGTILNPGQYLVIANDQTALQAKYPTARILGNFTDNLPNSGGLIVLKDNNNNPADEVRYYNGGRWDDAAAGGGSSLELRDPDADNSQGEAWSASDESARSGWTHYEYSTIVTAPVYDPPINFNEFWMGLLDTGEVLLDNISVIENPSGAGTQLIQNGSFTADTLGAPAAKWRIQGTHSGTVIVDPTNAGNKVLDLVATAHMHYLSNHAETTLVGNVPIVNGREYKISFDAKWVSGSPQFRTELYYNDAAKLTILPTPTLSGTPGSANSRRETNIGPTYTDFKHSPTIPEPNEAITISATAADPDGVSSMTLWYRVGTGAWTSAPMTAGSGGVYQGQIVGQAAGAVINFYVEGQDSLGAKSTFPRDGRNSRALIKVNDGLTPGPRHGFRIIMMPEEVNALYLATNMMNNNRLGATLVYDNEVFYDLGARLKGSMHTRNNPGGTGYDIDFNEDQRFRGIHDSVAIKVRDPKELLVHFMAVQGGVPWQYDDLISIVTPGGAGSGVAKLTTGYDNEYLDSVFEDGGDGTVFKMEGIRIMQRAAGSGPEDLKTYFPNVDWVGSFDLTNLGDDKELYRWPILISDSRERDDYTQIIAMMQALSLSGNALAQAAEATIDVSEWMRTFALMSLAGIGDTYTQGNPHNINFYVRPEDNKVVVLPWDWDFTFNNATNAPLWGNQNLSKLIALPQYTRVFQGHMLDLINTVYNTSYMSPWMTMYGNLSGQNFSSFLTYIQQRTAFVMSQLPAQVPFQITTNAGNNFNTDQGSVVIGGNAWINVDKIYVEGRPDPLKLTWIDADSWQATIPLKFGANALNLLAYNYQGNVVANDTITVTTTFSAPSVTDDLRITEIMYHPAAGPIGGLYTDSDFEFIELQNIGASPLPLNDVQFAVGISADLPAETLAPGEYGVLVSNRDAFGSRYGNGPRILGTFTGNLNNAGERLRLETTAGVGIHDFTFDDDWYPTTDGDGKSLVIINSHALATAWGQQSAWRPSGQIGGSPGAVDILTSGAVFASAFRDNNTDGIRSATEFGAPQVNVALFSAGPNGQIGGGDDVQVSTGTTNPSGQFSFSDLVPGAYFLQYTAPLGAAITRKDQGADDHLDSDADLLTGRTNVFSIIVGQIEDSFAAGLNRLPLAVPETYSVNEDAVLTATDPSDVRTTLISTGSVWKYLDEGSDQGQAWPSGTFTDTAWKQGAAELGYGDTADTPPRPEVTVVSYGTDPNLKHWTTYFRRKFTVADPSVFTSLELEFMRDDGIVVYINGHEVKRDSMPGEPGDDSIFFNTPASAGIAGTDEFAFHTFTISTEDLFAGENTIAVEIHQAAQNSSDISFDLKLTGVRHISGGVLTNDSDPDGAGIALYAAVVTLPTHGSLSMTPNGHFTYTPTTNYSGADTFTYKINDGLSDSAPATVTINVAPLNDPPVANAGGPYATSVGANLSLNGADTTDPDHNLSQLTFEWDLSYDGSSFQVDTVGVSPTVSFATAGTKTIAVRVNDPLGASSTATTTVQVSAVAAATIAGRRVFYNQSKFDGDNAAAGSADDAAIATDKTALLPSGTSSFANYTSYNRGLNGIMVDIANLPAGALSASDFGFKVGNSSTTSAWAALATAPTVTVRPGAGVGGSSRVTLIWPSGAGAIRQWLQVTVKANANTGLATPDIFYFGSAVAESGDVAGDYSVSIIDELLARNNAVSVIPGAVVTNRFDYNRDGTVSVIDQLLSRNNLTTVVTKLQQITVPAALQASGLVTIDSGRQVNGGEPASLPASLRQEKPPENGMTALVNGTLQSELRVRIVAAVFNQFSENEWATKRRLPRVSEPLHVDGDLLETLARRR